MSTPQEIKAWQDRLITTFGANGAVGVRFLADARAAERVTGAAFVHKFHGHRVLTDSFLEFFGGTLRAQSTFNNKKGWPQDQPYYMTALMMYLTVFRTIRSAELLSERGYVLRAYAIQRSVKDQLWILCAAANEIATFDELFGWGGGVEDVSTDDQDEIFKAQLNTENMVRRKIIGSESGLSKESEAQLLIWERMFNKEVHRAQFSLFRASAQLLENPDLQLGPVTDDLSDAMYLNRSMELNWVTLRLLPFMRRADTPKDGQWSANWQILEESFRFMFDGFNGLGKAIAPAFLEMLESKCKFDSSTYFKEPRAKDAPAVKAESSALKKSQ
jgi:hypothetical protein